MTTTTDPTATPVELSTAVPVDDPVGWEPNRHVFCAVIFAQTPGTTRQQVASTRWASLDEARGFIERRLPTVREVRPAEAKVSGYVVPAVTHTRMRDGELVQDVVLNWPGAQQGHLNPRGFVTWQ